MRESTEASAFYRAVGRNVRNLRECAGRSQDELARSARVYGLTWDRAKVAALERGEKPLSVYELAALLPALTNIGVQCDVTSMHRTFATPHAFTARHLQIGEAEQKAARRLGVPIGVLSAAAVELWGKSMTAEREARMVAVDRRLVARAMRGHTTRALIAEIEEHLGRSGR